MEHGNFSLPLSPDEQQTLLRKLKESGLREKKSRRRIKQLEHDLEFLNTKVETERSLNAFNIREKEKQYFYNQLLLEACPSILFILDGRLRYVIGTDKLLTGFFGFADDLELNGLFLAEIFKNTGNPRWVEDALEACHEALEEKRRVTYTELLTFADSRSFCFTITVTPSVDCDGRARGIAFLMHDITELAHARDAAESASQAKSAFLASMSHEIRTPMNAITGITNLLGTTSLTARQKEYLSIIAASSESLMQIINDILDFSKIGAGKLELIIQEYHTEDAIRDVTNMVNFKAVEKGLAFITDIDPRLPSSLVGDELRVKQILINLLNNAVKYTHEGHVLFSITFDRQEEGILLRCSVTDTGIGIRSEECDAVFSQFTQLDTVKNKGIQGTGLGLSISKQLALAMGGDIFVQSEYGKGSTFTLSVPQAVADPAPLVKTPVTYGGMVLVAGRGKECETLGPMLEHLQVPYRCAEEPPKDRPFAPEDFFAVIYPEGTCRPEAFFGGASTDRIIKIALKKMGADAGTGGRDSRALYEPVLVTALASALAESWCLQAEASDDASGDASGSACSPFFATEGARVLLVDDNEINLLVAEELLQQYCIFPDKALSGQDAVDLAQEQVYDIIFMDQMMPEMDGLQATRAIRDQADKNRATPIVALTANAMMGMREFFLENDLDDYLSKPIELDDLGRILKQWLPAEKII